MSQALSKRLADDLCRFNRISWGDCGLIACGKENGEMDLYDAKKLIKNDEKSLHLRTNNHSGPVRGLHFNPAQTNLLASGATDGEILIWDMNQLSKPYAPGPKSQRLEDVTCLAWNKEVPHILASGSTNGYTVVWDLRSRKELIKIPYPGGRKPITSICWNPDKPTQMITCSDDDTNPVILSWDLRNASAAERTFSGHTKGILAMDWCPKDSELLLSCGKDNRTIVWNTNTGEPIGDLAHSGNWAFDVKWCPRNPDLCVVASFDGKVALHSIQNTGSSSSEEPFSPASANHAPADSNTQPVDPNDPFAQIGAQDHSARDVSQPIFSLPHPPKWLRRSVGAVFGFGGKLISFDATSTQITVKKVPINDEIAFRADQLDYILQENNPETSAQYCDYMAHSEFVTDQKEKEVWLFLKRIFLPSTRDDMSDFVGYDQSFSTDQKLANLVKKLSVIDSSPDPLASSPSPASPGNQEIRKPKVIESSPFSFYSTKPGEDNDVDTLITKAIIVGDFELAVNVSLGAGRYADAFVLAANGSPELLQRTQQEYFKKIASTKPYLRILRSIVAGDLSDLISNAKLDSTDGWKDLIGVICTYAKPEQFAEYFALLGSKLYDPSFVGVKDKALKNHAAALCFIGSGQIEKLVNLWCPAMKKEEKLSSDDKSIQSLAERISMTRQAIQFHDPALSLESPPEESERLKDLYNSYVKYAWTASIQGNLDIAWRFLENVPLNFIPSFPIDISILRDRVYASHGHVLGVTGQSPLFPFEVTDVIDGEALRIAAEYEEKQRLAQLKLEQSNYQQQQSYQSYQSQSYQQSYQQQQQGGYGNYPQQTPSWQQPQAQSNWNQPATSVPSSNQWQQPVPVVNQFQQPPPVVNQFQQPPPVVNQFQQQPPVNNQFQQPPPVNNQFQQPPPVAVNQWQPQQQQQQWVPSSAPRTSLSAPGATGHAPPIPTTHFQPPVVPQPTNQSFQRAGSFSTPSVPPSPPAKSTPIEISNPMDKACYDHIVRLLADAKTKNADKKSMEEADKKLDLLFEALCGKKIPAPVIDELESLCRALDKSDFSNAKRMLTDLMSKRFDITGPWIVGIKRIVDALDKASRPSPSSSMTFPQNPSPISTPQVGLVGPPPINGTFSRPPSQSSSFGPPPISFGAPPIQKTVPPPPPTSHGYTNTHPQPSNFAPGARPLAGNHQMIPQSGPPSMNAPPLNRPQMNGPPLSAPPLNRPQMNGPPLSAPSMNRPQMNGPPLSGPPINRPQMNGPPLSGPPTNRPQMNGPPLSGPPTNRPQMNGPPLSGPPVNRPPMNGPSISNTSIPSKPYGNQGSPQNSLQQPPNFQQGQQQNSFQQGQPNNFHQPQRPPINGPPQQRPPYGY